MEGQSQPQVSSAANSAPSSGNAKVISRFGASNAQPKVQPVQSQVQQAQANVPPKANAAPTAPTANSAQPSNPQPAQSVPTAYHSANTSKTAQKIDPFAEQNAKRAEKKAQTKKQAKKGIFISIIVVIILIIAAIVCFLLIKNNQPDDRPWMNDIPSIDNDSDDSVNKIQRYLQEVYNDNTSGNTKSAKLESANQATAAIIDHGDNSSYTNQIVLAQIKFYLTNGYYDEIIDKIPKVNVNSLNPQQKLSFYNCLMLAYQAQGNQTKYDEYSNLMLEVSVELNGTGEYADE